MTDRLKWHIGYNLRWLAENKGADYLPCGMLHGVFLTAVADRLEQKEPANKNLTCSTCAKRLSRKTARLINNKLLCSACMFDGPTASSSQG